MGVDGDSACLVQLWIKGVYLVDNFWPVDKSKNRKLSTGYAQWQENNRKSYPQGYPHSRLLSIYNREKNPVDKRVFGLNSRP